MHDDPLPPAIVHDADQDIEILPTTHNLLGGVEDDPERHDTNREFL